MASSFNLPNLQAPILHKSHFRGQNLKSSFPAPKQSSSSILNITAKFNLFEILGGRGLCNGEAGLEKELKKSLTSQESSQSSPNSQEKSTNSEIENIPESGFEKELLGLTGGFPGGEKGLKKFIEENPPPKKSPSQELATTGVTQSLTRKAKPPELPLLMPGMIAIVKNPNSPYHMYCGIVQRITDGKAGVLFEGGNWDRLITFRLDELERREKGPPMVSPRSVVLELVDLSEQNS